MAFFTLPHFIAQATYGQGSYGSESYQQSTIQTSSDGSLANTGMPVVLGGTVGVALIFCAVILFIKSRKK